MYTRQYNAHIYIYIHMYIYIHNKHQSSNSPTGGCLSPGHSGQHLVFRGAATPAQGTGGPKNGGRCTSPSGWWEHVVLPKKPNFCLFPTWILLAMFLHVVFLLLEIHPIFEGESLKCKRRRCLLSHRAIGLKPARKFKKPLEIYRGKTVKVRLKPSQWWDVCALQFLFELQIWDGSMCNICHIRMKKEWCFNF